MKYLLFALFLGPLAYAQTAPTPPAVAMPMPAPSLTMSAGESLTLTWNPVTEDTNGNALTGPATYNVWEVQTGTAVLRDSGLTTPTRVHADMAAGTDCYVVTASVAGDTDSVGSTPPVCVSINAAPAATPQVGAPTGVTAVVTP